MKLWLAAAAALVLAARAPTPLAAQAPTVVSMPAQHAAPARSDSLARAALSATTARRRVFVDVRTPAEFAGGHLPRAVNLPLADLEQRWPELKAYRRRQIVLYCRSGHRAQLALELVTTHGITNARNGGGYESLSGLLAAAP